MAKFLKCPRCQLHEETIARLEGELAEAWRVADEHRKRGNRYQARASQAERNEKQADSLLTDAKGGK